MFRPRSRPPSSPTTSAGTDNTAVAYRRRHHPHPLLRTLLSALRILLLLFSLYILGLFIYLLHELVTNDVSLTDTRYGSETLAILILAGVSTIWTLLSLILTCVGHYRTGFMLLVFDLVHVGAFIGVAILLRQEGFAECGNLPGGSPQRDCELQKAAFAFAIVLAVGYFFATIMSALMVVAFRRSRAYGPSPENGYSEKWNRVPHRKGYIAPTLPTTNNRQSLMTDDSRYSGSTVAHPQGVYTSNTGYGAGSGVNPPTTTTATTGPGGLTGLPPLAPGSAGGYEPYRKPHTGGYHGSSHGGSMAELEDSNNPYARGGKSVMGGF